MGEKFVGLKLTVLKFCFWQVFHAWVVCGGRHLGKTNNRDFSPDEPKKLVSEVVLLTDDRNLRVKALARDVPVRELVDFMQWAGLG